MGTTGFNMCMMCEGVRLLKEVPWTTQTVEQQHGSMAVMHRSHRELTGPSLATRAFLHSIRALVDRDPFELRVDRQERRVAALLGKMPRKAGGFQMFFGDCIKSVSVSLPAGRRLSANAAREVLKDAGWRWRQLSEVERDTYRLDAQDAAQAKTKDKDSDVEFLRDELAMAVVRQEQESVSRGVQYRMAAVRFDDHDITAMGKVMTGSSTGRQALGRLRDARCSSPTAPSIPVQRALLDAVPVLPELSEKGNITKVSRVFARYRDLMRHVVVMIEDDPRERAFLFLFATKTPIRAYFGLMELQDRAFPPLAGMSFTEQVELLWSASHRFNWQLQPGQYCTDQHLMRHATKPLWVFSHISWQLGGRIVCEQRPHPFDYFTSRPSGR